LGPSPQAYRDARAFLRIAPNLHCCDKVEEPAEGRLADIPKHVRPEAEVALKHAGRFISTAAVDTARLDLSKPLIYQPRWAMAVDRAYDWSVLFVWATPSPKPPYGISIAVRNDGTCWIEE